MHTPSVPITATSAQSSLFGGSQSLTPHGGDWTRALASFTSAMPPALVRVRSTVGLLVDITHSPFRPPVEEISEILPSGSSRAFGTSTLPGHTLWERDSTEPSTVNMCSLSGTSALFFLHHGNPCLACWGVCVCANSASTPPFLAGVCGACVGAGVCDSPRKLWLGYVLPVLFLRHGGPPPKTTQICSTARFLEGRPLFTAIHERTSGIRCQ